MEMKDLKEGEIYVTSYPGQGNYIFRQKLPNTSTKSCINDRDNNFMERRGLHADNGFHEYHNPTRKQKAWFLECERQKKFVPLSAIKLDEIINEYEIF